MSVNYIVNQANNILYYLVIVFIDKILMNIKRHDYIITIIHISWSEKVPFSENGEWAKGAFWHLKIFA